MINSAVYSNAAFRQLGESIHGLSSKIDEFKHYATLHENEQRISHHYNELKAKIWYTYFMLFTYAQKFHYTDTSYYEDTLKTFNDFIFKIINVCDYYLSDLKVSDQNKVFFTELKIKTYYYYLLYTYFLKRTPHSGVWQSIHQMYSHTYRQRTASKLHQKQYQSVLFYYKRIVLLSLFQPYNMNTLEYQKLVAHIDSASKFLKIDTQSSKNNSKFIVLSNLDSPTVNTQTFRNIDSLGQCFYVNLKRIIQYFNLAPYLTFYRKHVDSDIDRMLAKDIIRFWTAPTFRTLKRHPVNMEGECTFSYKSTWHYLKSNHEKEFTNQEAKIINKSEKGFCLEFPKYASDIKPGELIGVREGSFDFFVCVIRWVRETENQRNLVGVEVIALNPQPVSASLADYPEQSPILAFLYGQYENMRYHAMLLAPTYPFKPGSKIVTHNLHQEPVLFNAETEKPFGHYKAYRLSPIPTTRQ